ncbi:AraC family transcriptional regulator [Aliikangiella coralliicola]|uniref:Helix-turn-helix domain-containing protein n=1 Tax=Aliikangiella coralliicola TaxID=2592383 RepID=A0A545UBT8_9GAMM|nr:AraC family transcriptional regulator [Aliikangiella coralliicola]TQV86932.1 helix-turn-helix domain-containing protein [Aliikangiella coralliicola]
MTDHYLKKFKAVLDYIDVNLDTDFSIDELSRVAFFSKFHFHRQFSELLGLPVSRYIQLQRMKRASYQLAFRGQFKIIDIAMIAGFENPESFSRAFKKLFGQTPMQFRNAPDWEHWYQCFQVINSERIYQVKKRENYQEVKIVEFKETRVAALEHHGAPEKVFESVRTFIRWRKEVRLSPNVSETYNILYNDPEQVAAEDYQLDICASVTGEVDDNSYGIIEKTIPGGRCAVIRHLGSDQNLRQSFEYLYGQWLPQSGEELRDFPCFLHRVNLFPDIKEHEMITDIYLPLE